MSSLVPKHLGAFILLLLVTVLPFCTGQYTYYVKPTPDTPCHEDPCHTLSEYASEAERYFTSNTTMVFLPGEHALQDDITVRDLVRFVLQQSPSSSAQIVCVNNTFTFENVSTIEITGLSFVSCRFHLNGSHAIFWDVQLEDGMADYGGAVYAHNSTLTFEGETRFEGNSAAVAGGGIFSEESKLTFHGINTFINNKAMKYGGGIYIFQSYVNFLDTPSLAARNNFTSNSVGKDGGGLYAANSRLNFAGNSSFANNFANSEGGSVYVTLSIVSFVGNNCFMYNSVEWVGGGVFVGDSYMKFVGNNSFTQNIANDSGGSLWVWNSTVRLIGNTTFVGSEGGQGGGVYTWDSRVSFAGNNTFTHNSAGDGGGVYAEENSIVKFSGHSIFTQNLALGENSYGGAIAAQWGSTVFVLGTSSFIYNSAEDCGGAISIVISSNGYFSGNSIFTQNSAVKGGGGVHMQDHSALKFAGNSSFMNNTAQNKGGGINVEYFSTLSIDGKSYFNGNTASYFGGGLASLHSTVEITGKIYFTNNFGKYGGGIYADKSNISWSGTNTSGNANFLANSVMYDGYGDGNGGAIHALSSNLIFDGNMEFNNNSAGYGGAIALSGLDHSKIYLLANTKMIFTRNFALHHGGAIHVEDNPFTNCIFESNLQSNLREACFFQLMEHQDCASGQLVNSLKDYGIQLLFQDNAAYEAGSILYGGNLELCRVCISYFSFVTGAVAFDTWGSISKEVTSTSDITSDPYHVCVCEDDHPECRETMTTREVYPGEIIHIAVVAVGQRNGTTPAVIRADWDGLEIGNLQNTQITNKTCSLLQYTVLATDPETAGNRSIILYADEPCSRSGFPLTIKVKFLSCPDGFSLSTQGRCACEERLQRYTTECDIHDQSIQCNGEFWVGFDDQLEELILHPHCPFDYCKSGTINITLNNSDVQCDHNRSGILCGACQQHLSLALGSSQCLPCSNTFLALIVPFTLAGFALVIFLFICKLTVVAGTISGLIFYANIIAVNKTMFFPSGETSILTVFIAWLNLDLGIETCFFDGMDAYSTTWLQFVFPIHIWLLVGLVAILCNVSTTAARILGSTNPIAVLATLFLLSYTKLLRTIIAAFSFTTLEYPDDEIKVVWLYDGNIGYLDKNDGRHIALFLASLLVFLFLFLPYTLFLHFGQCILPRLDPSKLRWLSWANYLKTKSFLDAYHAPYKDRHRYWIGLLLLMRFIVFLVSAIVDIESPQDPHVNLLVIIACNIGLAIWGWNVGGMYKKWYLNALESSFILNLVLLSAATYHVKLAGGDQAAVFYTSVSIAFATFIGIIIYHVCQLIMDTRVWRNLVRKIHDTRQPCQQGEDAAMEMEEAPSAPRPPPTVTFVDLREPLLST